MKTIEIPDGYEIFSPILRNNHIEFAISHGKKAGIYSAIEEKFTSPISELEISPKDNEIFLILNDSPSLKGKEIYETGNQSDFYLGLNKQDLVFILPYLTESGCERVCFAIETGEIKLLHYDNFRFFHTPDNKNYHYSSRFNAFLFNLLVPYPVFNPLDTDYRIVVQVLEFIEKHPVSKEGSSVLLCQPDFSAIFRVFDVPHSAVSVMIDPCEPLAYVFESRRVTVFDLEI